MKRNKKYSEKEMFEAMKLVYDMMIKEINRKVSSNQIPFDFGFLPALFEDDYMTASDYNAHLKFHS